MTTRDELIEIEHAGWDALRTSGEAATAHYATSLADDVLMLLPGGLVITDRQQVVDSMGGAPWDEVQIDDEQVLELGDSAAVVSYRAKARRGDHRYEALFNSTYVRENGDWHLALHQQTPV